MCVIYKNGIIRIRRNYLNSAGHALALFERRKDTGKIKSREYGANCGTHRVINGEVTGYAYVCSADFIVPKEFVLHRGGGADNIFATNCASLFLTENVTTFIGSPSTI